MNGLGKAFRRSDSKNKKNSKDQSEIAACEQKTTSEKANFSKKKFFLRNKQSQKLNKNIPIAKTLEAFIPKPAFDPFKYTYFKNISITNFSPKSVQDYSC